MSDEWRDQLAGLAEAIDLESVEAREWSEVVEEAHATVLAVQGLAALGRVREHSGGDTYGRDAVLLGIDAIRNPITWVDEQGREAVLAALRRFGSNKYVELTLDEILERLEAMTAVQIRGLMNGVQGTLFELEVGQAFVDGAFPLPEDAASGVILDRNAAGLDGYFVDEESVVTEPFQIKATDSLGPIRRHLDANPDIDQLILTSEVAATAEAAGIDGVIDSGIELDGLMPRRADAFRQLIAEGETADGALAQSVGVASEMIPLVTLAVASAEVAWSWARGGDLDEELRKFWPRATRATVISALAHGASVATGFEPARIAVIVGGQASVAAVGRIDRELAASIDHVRGCRRILDDLVGTATSVS